MTRLLAIRRSGFRHLERTVSVGERNTNTLLPGGTYPDQVVKTVAVHVTQERIERPEWSILAKLVRVNLFKIPLWLGFEETGAGCLDQDQ